MTRRKKHQNQGPRRHRLRWPARLVAAQTWMASGARVNVRTYARWFGVDRYCAYDELRMLGAPLASGDEQWATRPPPVPKTRRDHRTQSPVENGLPGGWIEWGGELIFPVGGTAGGFPFGLFAWELDDREGAETFGAAWDVIRRRWPPDVNESSTP